MWDTRSCFIWIFDKTWPLYSTKLKFQYDFAKNWAWNSNSRFWYTLIFVEGLACHLKTKNAIVSYYHHCYTPGIYAEGYILFVFPFMGDSVPFVELLWSFMLKFLKWGISHQPLIRKHSYLDHRYPGGSALIPWLLTPGPMPRGGARGQNLGHL